MSDDTDTFEDETPPPRKRASGPQLPEEVLTEKLDAVSVLLTRTTTRLEANNRRLDDFSARMDRMDKQRDFDRSETNNIQQQLSAISAVCKLHVERTAAAEANALEAVTAASQAKASVVEIESSWHDMRGRLQSRPSGSAEYAKVVDDRQRAKEQEAAEYEKRVAHAAAEAVKAALAARDEARRQAQAEQAEIDERIRKQREAEEAVEDRRRKIRRAAIQWSVGLAVSTILTVVGSSFWNQAKSNQEATAKTLEVARVLRERVAPAAVPPDAAVWPTTPATKGQ